MGMIMICTVCHRKDSLKKCVDQEQITSDGDGSSGSALFAALKESLRKLCSPRKSTFDREGGSGSALFGVLKESNRKLFRSRKENFRRRMVITIYTVNCRKRVSETSVYTQNTEVLTEKDDQDLHRLPS